MYLQKVTKTSRFTFEDKRCYESNDKKNLWKKIYNCKINNTKLKLSNSTYTKKINPIRMCIDIPLVNTKPIGSPFH